MNRYWAGLWVTSFVGLGGLYMLYLALRGQALRINEVLSLSPGALLILAVLAEVVFFSYLWLGFSTGVFDL